LGFLCWRNDPHPPRPGNGLGGWAVRFCRLGRCCRVGRRPDRQESEPSTPNGMQTWRGPTTTKRSAVCSWQAGPCARSPTRWV
jgi:hypothetical protein